MPWKEHFSIPVCKPESRPSQFAKGAFPNELIRTEGLDLFAKDPVAGQVKTRTLLDAKTACQLYLHLLDDTIAKISSLPNVDLFVGIHPTHASGYFDGLARSHKMKIFDQEGADLGQRMRQAFQQRFKEGYKKVVIVGADSPTLPRAYLEQALRTDRQVVIGPCTDGGYYLVAMSGGFTEIFESVSWGTGRVLSETLLRIREANAELELLPVWYDVDRPDDLQFLKTHLEFMVHAGLEKKGATLEFLNRLNF